ncbi:MAG: adenylate kinase [Chloroflexi bacterium]|nr:adenylate kinase [Chloroflexota bacterium]
MKQRTYLVFMGPPGSGKGTQARILQDSLGIPQVSTGDIFRSNIKDKTELGMMAKGYMDEGELVPDDVTIQMVKRRLAEGDCDRGVIFDGFPRNLVQVVALDGMLAPHGGVSLAPILDVRDDEVMRRITGRRVCRLCGEVYHIRHNPPQVEGVCDRDGGELYLRDDDHPNTVVNRLFVYYKQTSPLVGYYFAKGLLANVNGSQSPDEVTEDMLNVLAEHGIVIRVSPLVYPAR